MYMVAPPLDPAWLEFEKQSGLLLPQPEYASLKDRQKAYAQKGKDLNAQMINGRDHYLADVKNADSVIHGSDGRPIPIRTYDPVATPSGSSNLAGDELEELVIYYHGGGLRVGDLDSEDLSCRRICKEASVTVISVAYRLMPDYTPDDAVKDAFDAFNVIIASHSPRKLVVLGSSSGGQLAAQVSQLARDSHSFQSKSIDGVLLRCPVTVDPGEGGIHIPLPFRSLYASSGLSFQNSLSVEHAVNSVEKASNMPLNAQTFEKLPRTFLQICSTDIYYSDGMCYAEALQSGGVEVKVDIVVGWPHTFWLKAPQLERALQAEMDMIEGLKWLLGR